MHKFWQWGATIDRVTSRQLKNDWKVSLQSMFIIMNAGTVFNSSTPCSGWSAKPGNATFFTHKRSFFDFLENPNPESHRASHVSLGPGMPGPSGTQLLIVAVCACALHAQLHTANVEINVYFPGGFLRSDSRVFLSSENNNEVRVISNDTQLKINVFGKCMTCSLHAEPRSQEYSRWWTLRGILNVSAILEYSWGIIL